jgi:hypothetical protein
VQLAVGRELLDGEDVRAVGLDRDGARLGAPAVDEDGAGAALTRIAADVRAGEIELLAQACTSRRRGSTFALRSLPLTVTDTWAMPCSTADRRRYCFT